MSQQPDQTAPRRPSIPAAGAVDEARSRRRWWAVVADALARAERRIVAGFRVPPHGG